MEKIEIRFLEVINLSQQIADTVAAIQKLESGSLTQLLRATKAAYHSESADLLVKKEVKVNAQLLQEADRLQRLAKDLEKKAKNMYHAESVNQMLARTRNY